MDKSSWTANAGVMTFILPDKTTHDVPATKIDRPTTICSLLDTLAGMSSFERRTVLNMAIRFEMSQMYPPRQPQEKEG